MRAGNETTRRPVVGEEEADRWSAGLSIGASQVQIRHSSVPGRAGSLEAVRRSGLLWGPRWVDLVALYGDHTSPPMTPSYCITRDGGGTPHALAARCSARLPIYQPTVPVPPLNGPTTSLVIQPP